MTHIVKSLLSGAPWDSAGLGFGGHVVFDIVPHVVAGYVVAASVVQTPASFDSTSYTAAATWMHLFCGLGDVFMLAGQAGMIGF